ncbi:uncharacterized protein LOC111068772 [Drosophila obscura]|uniref:uncharacterized protein LOC111068772 n=1 Tax=Drosophila obscura TaxID=7282 RepID=UPI000BA14F8E|nr:uncharacterized protein LOC111068772 [Drosophila obscura]
MSLRNQKSQTSISVVQVGRQAGRRASAGPDEIHNVYIKRIVSDWRDSVRERRYTTDSRSSRSSRLDVDKGIGLRKNLTTPSFIRPSIQRPTLSPPKGKPLEIEYGRGSGEADRITVTEGVELYIHQPIKGSLSKPAQTPTPPDEIIVPD